MGRETKSAKVLHPKSQTKAEINTRIAVEDELKGNPENLKAPASLNANQKKIYNHIVSELRPSGILANLDSYVFELGVIAIDRLQAIEKMINQDFDQIYNRELMAAKTKYTADFFKLVNEACMSPQSRAKMGVIAANKMMEEKDPLLKVLKSKKSG